MALIVSWSFSPLSGNVGPNFITWILFLSICSSSFLSEIEAKSSLWLGVGCGCGCGVFFTITNDGGSPSSLPMITSQFESRSSGLFFDFSSPIPCNKSSVFLYKKLGVYFLGFRKEKEREKLKKKNKTNWVRL